ncbi:MAG: hypothetical protein ACI4XC_02825 [Eubacterium sp.]
MENQTELFDIEDIFENDEYVLIKATYKSENGKSVITSVGIKDETGDIVKIVDVDENCV